MDTLTLYLLWLVLRRRPDGDGQGAAGDRLDQGLEAVGKTAYDAITTGCGCCVAYTIVVLVISLLLGSVLTLWHWITRN